MADGNVDFINNNDPNDPNKKQGAGQQSGVAQSNQLASAPSTPAAGGQGGAQGGGEVSGSSGGNMQAGASGPTSSGRFTNIQKVLDANSGSQLGNTIGQKISGEADQVKSGLNAAQDKFQQAAQTTGQQIQDNKQYASNLISNAGTAVPNPGQQAAATASGSTGGAASGSPQPIQYNSPDQAALARFSGIRSGAYNGPTGGLDNANQLQAQAQSASAMGNLANSDSGRQALLQRYVGGTDYSGGQQQLDSLLLGNNSSGLQDARRATYGLGNMVSGVNDSATLQAKTLQNQNNAVTDDVNKQLTGAQAGLNTDLDTGYKAAFDKESARQDMLNKIRAGAQGQVGINVDPSSGNPNAGVAALFNQKWNPTTQSGDQTFKDGTPATVDAANIEQYKQQGLLNDSDYGFLKGLYNPASYQGDSYGKWGTNDATRGASQALADMYTGYDGTKNLHGFLPDVAHYAGGPQTVSQQLVSTLKDTGPTNLTRTGVASDQQVARLNALSQLSSGNASTQAIDPTRAAYQAGQAHLDAADFKAKYDADKAAAAAYDPFANSGF